MKKCRKGESINTKTSRCRKNCKKTQFRNSNGRCVKQCTRDQVRNSKGRCVKKCTQDQVRNSKGRCVKKPKQIPLEIDHRISTDFIQDKPKNKPQIEPRGISLGFLPPKPSDISKNNELECMITRKNKDKMGRVLRLESELNRAYNKNSDGCVALTKLFGKKILPNGWRITKLLGNGSFGVALGTRGPSHQSGALKLINEKNFQLIQSEIDLSKIFNKIGLTPKSTLMASVKIGKYDIHAIHMGRIDGVVGEFLEQNDEPPDFVMDLIIKKLFRLIDKLYKEKLIHGDLHLQNVGYIHPRCNNSVGKLQVIDLGYAYSGRSLPALEVVQLLRSLYYDKISKYVFNYLDKGIRKQALQKYGFRFPKNLESLSRKFSSLRTQLRNIRKI